MNNLKTKHLHPHLLLVLTKKRENGGEIANQRQHKFAPYSIFWVTFNSDTSWGKWCTTIQDNHNKFKGNDFLIMSVNKDANKQISSLWWVCMSVWESDHAAAEGVCSGLHLIGQLLIILWLSSKCVQRHRAVIAAEGATAKGLPAAVRPQSHRAGSRLPLFHFVDLQPASWHNKHSVTGRNYRGWHEFIFYTSVHIRCQDNIVHRTVRHQSTSQLLNNCSFH